MGKAAASVTLLHPILGEVQVFNTHVSFLPLPSFSSIFPRINQQINIVITQLFAKGGEDGPEHNRAHRLVNAWELAKLARRAAALGRYVIAVSVLLLYLIYA